MSFHTELRETVFGATVIMRRRWRRAILFFIAVMVVTICGLIVCPRTYISESSMFVRVGRESVALDPTATTSTTIDKNESRENEINSIKDMLVSRSLFETVVEKMGAEQVLAPPVEDESSKKSTAQGGTNFSISSTLGAWAAAIGLSDPVGAEEKAIRKLQKSFSVSSSKLSNVITVRFEADTPQQAQRLMKEYLVGYRDLHKRVHRTAGSHEFFEDQGELIKKRLDATTMALKQAKIDLGVVSVPAQQGIVREKMQHVSTAILDNESALVAAKAKVASLGQELTKQPRRIETAVVSGRTNGAYDAIAAQLYTLQIRERELASKYTNTHPFRVAVQQQIEDAEKIAAEQPSERTETALDNNPTYQKLEIDFLTEQVAVMSLGSRLASLNAKRADLQDESKRLNEAQRVVEDLELEKSILEKSYRKYFDHREEARIDTALGDRGISNVNMLDESTLVARPIRPRKLIVLMLGFVFAVSGAIAFAYLSECLAPEPVSAESTPTESYAGAESVSGLGGNSGNGANTMNEDVVGVALAPR